MSKINFFPLDFMLESLWNIWYLYLCTAILKFLYFPSLYAIFYNIIYVYDITSFFFCQVVVPHKSWTGNVAATRLNGCFGELAKSSLHIQSSPLVMPFHQFQDNCIDLHHNCILQGFVLEILIFTSYFYINKSFLKENTAFENGPLRHYSIGFYLKCCSSSLEHPA